MTRSVSDGSLSRLARIPSSAPPHKRSLPASSLPSFLPSSCNGGQIEFKRTIDVSSLSSLRYTVVSSMRLLIPCADWRVLFTCYTLCRDKNQFLACRRSVELGLRLSSRRLCIFAVRRRMQICRDRSRTLLQKRK